MCLEIQNVHDLLNPYLILNYINIHTSKKRPFKLYIFDDYFEERNVATFTKQRFDAMNFALFCTKISHYRPTITISTNIDKRII